MMYDHEKSDPAIVAVKPTNKAGHPSAELVPELGSHGSVRGARGNSRPYRESRRGPVKPTRMTHLRHPPGSHVAVAKLFSALQ